MSVYALLTGNVTVRMAYDYDRVRKTGEEEEEDYVKPRNFTTNFDIQGMTIHLENLFNGEKFVGE
jgi:hypothetical protein